MLYFVLFHTLAAKQMLTEVQNKRNDCVLNLLLGIIIQIVNKKKRIYPMRAHPPGFSVPSVHVLPMAKYKGINANLKNLPKARSSNRW
jgi:hypothetical protein